MMETFRDLNHLNSFSPHISSLLHPTFAKYFHDVVEIMMKIVLFTFSIIICLHLSAGNTSNQFPQFPSQCPICNILFARSLLLSLLLLASSAHGLSGVLTHRYS